MNILPTMLRAVTKSETRYSERSMLPTFIHRPTKSETDGEKSMMPTFLQRPTKSETIIRRGLCCLRFYGGRPKVRHIGRDEFIAYYWAATKSETQYRERSIMPTFLRRPTKSETLR